jgi:hypothetical protein
MTIQLAMPGYMTTGASTNLVLDPVNPDNVFSGNTVTVSGIPFAQTGGPAPYVGTNGKLVLTAGGMDSAEAKGFDFQAIVEVYLCQGGNCPAPAPTVSSVSPTSGPIEGGTSVTITGANFVDGATVTIGGASATDVTWVSATSITATTPAGTAGAQDVVVTNPDLQTGTLPAGFTYVAAVTPSWVYMSTYNSTQATYNFTTYWQFTKIGQETLPYGTTNGTSTGGLCDKFEIYTYNDSACTVLREPTRQVRSPAVVTMNVSSPMWDWRQVDDHQMRQRYNVANTSGTLVTNTLYYRLYDPNPGFGAPFALGESWTFTEEINSSMSAGNKITNGITSVIADTTEVVTVPAGTFTCYKNTWTQLVTINGSGGTGYKQIFEYWDASGAFTYAPIKIVDSANFVSTDTKVLYSSPVLP